MSKELNEMKNDLETLSEHIFYTDQEYEDYGFKVALLDLLEEIIDYLEIKEKEGITNV